jgi:hypothetical protein
VRIELHGGRLGKQGAQLSFHLARPVSARETPIVMYFAGGAWQRVPASFARDRRTILARVHHFTDFWAGALHGAGSVLGSRTDPPTCSKRPAWVDDAVYFDDSNSPVRWCVGADERDKSLVTVKLKVNRGYGVAVHPAVTPLAADAHLLGSGPADLELNAVTHIAEQYGPLKRWFGDKFPVMGGGGLDLSFSEAQVRQLRAGTPLVRVERDPLNAIAGEAFSRLLGQLQSGSLGSAAAYFAALTAIGQCEGSVIGPASKHHFSQALGGAAKCLTGQADAVAKITAGVLADTFRKTDPRQLGRIAGELGRALKAVALIGSGFDATEWIADGHLDSAGFTVEVFPRIVPVRFTPDTNPLTLITADANSSYRVGPYRVENVLRFGPHSPTKLADVEARLGHDNRCSGQGTDVTVTWPARGVTGQFTTLGGIVDSKGRPITQLDSACRYRDQVYVDRLAATAPHWHTPKGLKIGDSLARLRQLYPGATEHPEGWWLHTVRLPFGDPTDSGDLLATVQNDRVTALTVVLTAEGD